MLGLTNSRTLPKEATAYTAIQDPLTEGEQSLQDEETACKTSWTSRLGLHLFIVVVLFVSTVLFLSRFQYSTPTSTSALRRWLEDESTTTPPSWIVDLVRGAGSKDGTGRGFGLEEDEPRATLAKVFAGTHVEGYATGKPHGILWAWRHARDDDYSKSEIGKVILSDNARLLRSAFKQAGFKHTTFYHGTKPKFVPSILSGGFLFALNGLLGNGVYVCSTFEHAQCYTTGKGGPIVEIEAYWRPNNTTQFLKHVPHESMVEDVYVVTDPLLIIPVEVHACCPKELTCT